MQDYNLIINSTPLGMVPNIESFPALPYEHANENHIFYDLVYKPEETMFLKKAKEQGATVANGFDMLIAQAEKNWEIWNE
jgi:shikimate dehydrogenase